MKTIFGIIVLVCILCGCAPDANMPLRETKPTQGSNRFQVMRVGVFADDLAYDGVRGIYVIKDESTGKEYFGVSGVGISETGQHSGGKTMIPDER